MLLFEKGITEFGHFNILTNDQIRNEIKKYSNWQTFPQIFINSSFVGGIDIIKELDESNELQKLIPSNCFDLSKSAEDLMIQMLINVKGIQYFYKKESQIGEFGKNILEQKCKPNFLRFFDVSPARWSDAIKNVTEEEIVPQLWIDGELIFGFPEIDDGEDMAWIPEEYVKAQ
eukprot:TRINITY_DN8405_c0_g1_i1.p1 TRINITY_DN8405_c0_g1~~TRINITY_DN8405_c0_g1_i1.p1  ORF type:complete len:173 (+),score=45.16 TRINITY_DN8405_c0_g1_i1:227-745(+)